MILWLKEYAMMPVYVEATMAIKSYQSQAELLLKEYLLADPFIPYTSIIGGIIACKMVFILYFNLLYNVCVCLGVGGVRCISCMLSGWAGRVVPLSLYFLSSRNMDFTYSHVLKIVTFGLIFMYLF